MKYEIDMVRIIVEYDSVQERERLAVMSFIVILHVG